MSTTDPSPPARWYALETRDVATNLGVDTERGLSLGEAADRLARHGRNELAEVPARSLWRLLLDQFRNLLIGVLLAAAILAGLIGDVKDAIVIGVVLVFNALLGFYQEHRAERSLAALREMLVMSTRVRRDGARFEVPSGELVAGDVVLLEAGDRVPADGRLAAIHTTEIDESSLTGESTPVMKHVEAIRLSEVPLADRSNMAFMNTVVTRGRAEMLVTATGARTEIGKLAGMLEHAGGGRTPLQLQLDVLGKRLALVAFGAVVVFAGLALARGESPSEVMLGAIALAVAAIPEGLPAVVTVTLSVGTYVLARRGAIVKRLASVETLGCTSVICSDKTGTLTVNQMTARTAWAGGRSYAVTGEGYRPEGTITPDDDGDASHDATFRRLMLAAVLCNDSDVRDGMLVGDPTEGALVTLAAKGGIDVVAERTRFGRISEIPFDSATKYMATLHRGDDIWMFVKGATDTVLPRCSRLAAASGDVTLDDATRASLEIEMHEWASAGLRVLAVAQRHLEEDEPTRDPSDTEVCDLTMLGLVGLLDPSRPEARDAIARCHAAGIDVKMITGDHSATALAIARDLGINGDALTGTEIDGLDKGQLTDRMADVGVFARVAPEHKIAIVEALQSRGDVVAMTGDGVNDAPALKGADIGVAMGITGTEVSKEAAAMVLTDDNFATIVGAVEQGRAIYDNIVKFVRFQLSTNMGAILCLVGAPLLGLPVPFAPIQILWINMIMDGPPAMALGLDPPNQGAMEKPPRDPRARILTFPRFARLLGFGLLMATGTLGVLAYQLDRTGEPDALALAFTTFVLFQVFNVFNVRSEHRSAFNADSLRNVRLLLAVGAVVVLQVLAVHVGVLRSLFKTDDLTPSDWLLAILVASSILWIEELHKLIRRAKPRESAS